jgi:hypothetical protein
MAFLKWVLLFRMLSSHFSGKSKSFANLSYACTVKDTEKSEKPFNKRRILFSSRISSFYSSFNPKSMPLLSFFFFSFFFFVFFFK